MFHLAVQADGSTERLFVVHFPFHGRSWFDAEFIVQQHLGIMEACIESEAVVKAVLPLRVGLQGGCFAVVVEKADTVLPFFIIKIIIVIVFEIKSQIAENEAAAQGVPGIELPVVHGADAVGVAHYLVSHVVAFGVIILLVQPVVLFQQVVARSHGDRSQITIV